MTMYPATFRKVNNRRIVTYPNQKIVSVNKTKTTTDELYFYSNHEATRTAMRILKHGALKLWLYLNMNQNGYEMALSPIDVLDKTGMSKATYDRAIEDLIEIGFLVRREEKGNEFDFFEKIVNQTDNYQTDNYQTDAAHTQTDTDKSYQNDAQQYQNDGQWYQNDYCQYQDDTTNITDITDKTNITSNIIGDEDMVIDGYSLPDNTGTDIEDYPLLDDEEMPF